jgi:transposase
MPQAKRRRRSRLTLKPHLHPDTLHALYREATDPVERARWHALWLLSQGRHPAEVAEILGYTDRWVRKVASLYNQKGPEAISDGRHKNPGQKPLLSPELQEELRQALLKPHPRDGLWTGRSVAEWLCERLGRPVPYNTAWEWMRRLGFSPLRPRPRHRGADPEAQGEFKKTLLPPCSPEVSPAPADDRALEL